MVTIAMWSGGKDSSLALWRALKETNVDRLLCMVHEGKARAHGIDVEIIKAQERAMGKEILTEETTWETYEERLKNVFRRIGVKKAIFGDIYLQEHRDWIERVCGEVGIEPVFPLWKEDTEKLAREFVAAGFEAYVIAVRKDLKEILGKKFDEQLIDFALENGVDPCGENGEFHTLVVDGPIFKERVVVEFGGVYEGERYYHLRVKVPNFI
ncbi:MAG: diphthine--ammonia ligase [Archaeoglobus sp.]|uniref:Dph6-related ATP pyrophosphatase n=1 Tax=Archaeoglobus sp. TaxID=1872626 RepID=UPI001D3517AB|nr:diphthine--ammonia ligase [Archaeoglobus sp.]MBO8179274.1 diphthine--ammonia ligase [Archaeoglobus sp.]